MLIDIVDYHRLQESDWLVYNIFLIQKISQIIWLNIKQNLSLKEY